MTASFFERPILNSPYECPSQHWELDADGQPTHHIIDKRRISDLITPVPKPKKRKFGKARVRCFSTTFPPRSRNTIPRHSLMKSATMLKSGGACPLPINGWSRRSPLCSCNTGGITRFKACGPSFVRLKRLKPPFG